jgi:sialic acid synthase SpsE
VAKKGQPIFLSTGMSTLEERDEAVKTILKYNKNLIIKHCVSVYPTPTEDLNIGAVTTLKERYAPLPVGYSGHEIGFMPTVAAVALGAKSVERHFTTDKSLPGPDHSTVSLDSLEFAQMVREIRRVEAGVADKNIYLHDGENKHRQKHSKSIVANVAIPAGTVINENHIAFKSTGKGGIKPTLAHTVIGRKAKINLEPDTVINTEEHLT